MRMRALKVSNYIGYHRDTSGYLKPCYACGATIYIKQDFDGSWRPYESWAAGNVDENEWVRHRCSRPAAVDSQKQGATMGWTRV